MCEGKEGEEGMMTVSYLCSHVISSSFRHRHWRLKYSLFCQKDASVLATRVATFRLTLASVSCFLILLLLRMLSCCETYNPCTVCSKHSGYVGTQWVCVSILVS